MPGGSNQRSFQRPTRDGEEPAPPTAPGVLGMWVGARASRPYIMLAVNENHGEELREAIPDSLDGINVYYLEGQLAG
jgi:hypothetical protein